MFHPLAQQHNHKDTGKSGYIELEDIAMITIGTHPRGESNEIHDGKCGNDKQRDQLVEPMRKEKEIVTAYPETCNVEWQSCHGHIYIQWQLKTVFPHKETDCSDEQSENEYQFQVSVS